MIIACPACSTRYVVPDSAIGIEGRTVRCAKCRHSWFQDGPEQIAAPPPPPAPSPPLSPSPVVREPDPAPEPAPADPIRSFDWDDSPPEENLPPPAAPAIDPAPARDDWRPPEPEPDRSPFAHEPPFRPRRNPAKLRNWIASGFGAAVLALVGALWWFGAPGWLSIGGPVFAEPNDLVLDFPANRQDRRTLPNGTEYFGASGTITNTGKETLEIPQILIVLRDANERVVYTSELAPPKTELAPGEAVTVNEALTDVPRSASMADIGWKDGG